jgi:hypothetical protein
LILPTDNIPNGSVISDERVDSLFQHDLDNAIAGAQKLFPTLGSSPRSRGTSCKTSKAFRCRRFIPALAGNILIIFPLILNKLQKLKKATNVLLDFSVFQRAYEIIYITEILLGLFLSNALAGIPFSLASNTIFAQASASDAAS